ALRARQCPAGTRRCPREGESEALRSHRRSSRAPCRPRADTAASPRVHQRRLAASARRTLRATGAMRTRPLMVLATAAGFALLTLAWLWPLPLHVRSSYLAAAADPSGLARTDAMLTSWMLAWGTHALRTDPIGLFHANILHPLPWTFALSEHLIAGALLVMPVDVLWHDPVLDDNALLLASFVLCGLGTTLLVRELGGGWVAAWLAGALVAFNPFRVATIGHVHALSTQWMPFALLAIHRCLRRGRGAVAVALAV